MNISDDLGLSGIAAVTTISSVCAVLLRSTHQNLKTLDQMRLEASAVAEKLRQELRDHDDTIFELQSLCADYRYAMAKLEADRDELHALLKHLQATPEAQKLKTPKKRPTDILP